MNFKEILELIDRVAEREIAGIEIEQAGTRLRIDGRPARAPQAPAFEGRTEVSAPAAGGAAQPLPSASAEAERQRADEEAAEAGLHVITSPIVGTFYRAPNPEADPFVSVGDRIARGKVLCIVEAMKLMNEIESEVEGVIVRVYPQNGQPVEYGEKLFAVRV